MSSLDERMQATQAALKDLMRTTLLAEMAREKIIPLPERLQRIEQRLDRLEQVMKPLFNDPL